MSSELTLEILKIFLAFHPAQRHCTIFLLASANKYIPQRHVFMHPVSLELHLEQGLPWQSCWFSW